MPLLLASMENREMRKKESRRETGRVSADTVRLSGGSKRRNSLKREREMQEDKE